MDTLKFSWIEWLPWKGWRIAGAVEAADEIPERLPPKAAVLVGTRSHPKWIAFDCPCKENHRIVVSLDPRTHPHWTAMSGAKLSLLPSIDAWRGSRRCHYIVKDGRIRWVRDTEKK
ncbi:DUF6527 family protein [Variovorax paradoxus]|uniref:DUF6527 family protein n=1 Tax=Variovorax paradoxus TaxID=34073 RepID=UPI003ECCD7A1